MLKLTSRWIVYPLIWVVAMLVPMVVQAFYGTRDATAEVNQFTVNSFDARYVAMLRDGKLALNVTETITATFQPYTNHGIERRLPTQYGGENIDLDVTDVTDESGLRRTYTTRSEAGYGAADR